jgi:hypothetical protein
MGSANSDTVAGPTRILEIEISPATVAEKGD